MKPSVPVLRPHPEGEQTPRSVVLLVVDGPAGRAGHLSAQVGDSTYVLQPPHLRREAGDGDPERPWTFSGVGHRVQGDECADDGGWGNCLRRHETISPICVQYGVCSISGVAVRGYIRRFVWVNTVCLLL